MLIFVCIEWFYIGFKQSTLKMIPNYFEECLNNVDIYCSDFSLFQFEKLKTNTEKVKFILKQIEENSTLRDNTKDFANTKNNAKAEEIRLDGNAIFARKDFYVALEMYNKSICMATQGSKELALVFGNRSAVYIELCFPKLCLQDIRNARESGYPKNLIGKINMREKMCYEMIRAGNVNQGITSKLPFDRVKPFVKPYLQRQENKEFGRFIVTKKNINPGEILITEDSLSNPLTRFRFCWNCMKDADMFLFPCKNCVRVMQHGMLRRSRTLIPFD